MRNGAFRTQSRCRANGFLISYMNGHLREHPLVELIREISAARLSGALRLRQERAQAALFFHEGALVFASTNLRANRLVECLQRWNTVAAEQLAQVVRDYMTDLELGEALIRAGALDRAGLAGLRARQALEALRPALLWTEGEWEFNPRVRLSEDARLRLDFAPLLTEAARRLPTEFVSTRLAADEEIISPTSSATDNRLLEGFALLPAEAFLLSRADAPLSVGELIALSGLPEGEARRMIYALALGGLLVRANWQSVFTHEALANARRAASAMQSSSPAPPKRKTTTPQTPSAPPVRDEKEELEYLFARTSTSNLYHRLGLTRRAKPEEIKRAYYTLAKRFHPDRFHKVDPEIRGRVESAFSQIMQAYETLQDSRTRAAYDLKLDAEMAQQQSSAVAPSAANGAATNSSPSSASFASKQNATGGGASSLFSSSEEQRAEESFQRGTAALREENYAAAAQHFAEAAQLMPREARYRAYYGHALAHEASTRRQAEAELHAAIALAPREAAYRVMLAELYLSIGLLRRAERELESALAVAPYNKDARRLLNQLRATESRGQRSEVGGQ